MSRMVCDKARGMMLALAFAAVALSLVTPAQADDKLLSKQRWREESYGLSLRPPLGSRLIEQSADSAVLRIVGEPNYMMAVQIQASERMVDVEEVQNYALQQVALAYPTAVIIEQTPLEIQGQHAAMFLFTLPPDREANRGKWVIGQTVVQIDATTVALIQVEMPHEVLTRVRPIYDAVVKSLEFEDPEALQQRREEAIERGEAWLAKIDAARLHKARIGDQWFRVLDKDQEIGFIRIQQRADTVMDEPGVRVDLHAQLYTGQTITESVSNFFLSDNLAHEIWSIRTTVKPMAAGSASAQRQATWVETGVRSDALITIDRETPSGKRQVKWDIPEGYLPQVVAHQVSQLLPMDFTEPGESQTLGFYSYYPNNGKISFRTEQVNVKPDGSYTVISRPTPEQQEQVSEFDARGNLIRRSLPSGWVMLPTTAAQVRAKWNVRP